MDDFNEIVNSDYPKVVLEQASEQNAENTPMSDASEKASEQPITETQVQNEQSQQYTAQENVDQTNETNQTITQIEPTTNNETISIEKANDESTDPSATEQSNSNEVETSNEKNTPNENNKMETDEAVNENKNDNNNENEEKTTTTTTAADEGDDSNGSEPELIRRVEEEEIDTNQCRICLSKENLVDIFKFNDKYEFRISDLVTKICTTIKIGERDYLPHFVCESCENRILSAYELKLQCEDTEKLLRSKLKRSKRTRRGPTEFVLIDAELSNSDSNEENQDDDEFHLSEVSEEESDIDSDISYEEKRKRPPPRRNRKKPMPKQTIKRKAPASRTSRNSGGTGVVYIDAQGSDDDDDDKRNVKKAKPSNRPQVKTVNPRLLFKCQTCNRLCGSAELLKEHIKVHTIAKCTFCAKIFRHRPTLLFHLQKHKDHRICVTCGMEFNTQLDCKRHTQSAHIASHNCNRCKQRFPSKSRLDQHKCDAIMVKSVASIRNIKSEPVKTVATTPTAVATTPIPTTTPTTGRDLFKAVAPPTTTYWSDSFSD